MGVWTAGFGLLADAVSTLQSFVVVFVGVYVLVIFAYVLTSFVRLPYSFNPVVRFLYDVCEPYLRLCFASSEATIAASLERLRGALQRSGSH